MSHTPDEPAPSTGELVSQLSSEMTRLVRDELKLAQLEVTGKAKKAGIGVGMFGAAGLIALYGVGVLLATAVLALALVVDAWLAALIVSAALFLLATIVALVGKKEVEQAEPPVPQQAISNVKEDVDALRNPGDHH